MQKLLARELRQAIGMTARASSMHKKTMLEKTVLENPIWENAGFGQHILGANTINLWFAMSCEWKFTQTV